VDILLGQGGGMVCFKFAEGLRNHFDVSLWKSYNYLISLQKAADYYEHALTKLKEREEYETT
jgi:hypothetical protein